MRTLLSEPCPYCGAAADKPCAQPLLMIKHGRLHLLQEHLKRMVFPYDVHLMLQKTGKFAVIFGDRDEIFYVEVEPDGVVHQLNKAGAWDGVLRLSGWPYHTRVYEILADGPKPVLQRIGMSEGRTE